jgi:hypothetical protein
MKYLIAGLIVLALSAPASAWDPCEDIKLERACYINFCGFKMKSLKGRDVCVLRGEARNKSDCWFGVTYVEYEVMGTSGMRIAQGFITLRSIWPGANIPFERPLPIGASDAAAATCRMKFLKPDDPRCRS